MFSPANHLLTNAVNSASTVDFKRNAATCVAAFDRMTVEPELAGEALGITAQEAFPVSLPKVAKAGILEIVRSLRIVALTPTRITGTGV